METTIQTHQTKQETYRTVGKTKSLSGYDKFIESLKFSYFGIISMTILIGSIVGGISAMYILKTDAPIWQLGLCMATAMANNVAAIGQAPTKWVVNLFLACIVVNAILILINL
ncbi:MAG: hypothetical protein ACXVNM_01830 [Bacteroidia bacterium]